MRGANKDEATQDCATFLFIASENGHTEVMRFLCENGPDKDTLTQDGATSLYVASRDGHMEVVRRRNFLAHRDP